MLCIYFSPRLQSLSASWGDTLTIFLSFLCISSKLHYFPLYRLAFTPSLSLELRCTNSYKIFLTHVSIQFFRPLWRIINFAQKLEHLTIVFLSLHIHRQQLQVTQNFDGFQYRETKANSKSSSSSSIIESTFGRSSCFLEIIIPTVVILINN